jgi:hypothetical protein
MREFAGNYSQQTREMDYGRSESSLVSGTCNEIPYSIEQGIFAADAGKLRTHGLNAGYICI